MVYSSEKEKLENQISHFVELEHEKSFNVNQQIVKGNLMICIK